MEPIAVLVLLLAAWLAFKAVGWVFKLVLWACVLGLAYWLAAPHLGLPLPG